MVLPRLVSALIALLAMGGAAAELMKTPGNMLLLRDLQAEFDKAELRHAEAAAASSREVIGGVQRPGIFLHPGDRDDAAAAFKNVRVPKPNLPGSILLLYFCIGLRDGIPWGTGEVPPNGVRFAVHVDGTRVFEEILAESVWRERCIDLTPWTDKDVTIEFRTNAIEGRSNYDWAVIGDPLVLDFHGVSSTGDWPAESRGLALAKLRCETQAEVTFATGEHASTAFVQAGTQWLIASCMAGDVLHLAVPDSGVEVESISYSRHRPRRADGEFGLSSPLVTAGRPFNAVFSLRNMGRGVMPPGHEFRLKCLDSEGRALDLGRRAFCAPLDAVDPGKEAHAIWPDLVLPRGGDWTLSIHYASSSRAIAERFVHVFPDPPMEQRVITPLEAPFRLTFCSDGVEAYLAAEVRQAEAWKRLGSIYPLARIDMAPKNGEDSDCGAMLIDACRMEGARAVLSGRRSGHRITIRLTPEAKKGRVHTVCELEAGSAADVYAFDGPRLLAGDRSYGVKKDFAVFPGLEYLEGVEHSSSERDLAWPLSDRRVPAPFRITAPLVAVQAQDTLFGMMWEMQQAWAPEETTPAVHFLAPAPKSGYEQISMRLLAPGVGSYLQENTTHAERPYSLGKGGRIRIESWWILDVAEGYPGTSVARSPHKGGLLLQVYQHYFDCFGFPEPSPPPRDWETEKALSMRAYFETVWGEEPPGWAHCVGWEPGLLVGHAVPQMLVQRESEDAELRQKIQDRVDRVMTRAIEEQGPHYLWTESGCHILRGELPFYYGYVATSLNDFRNTARAALAGRENGLWRWHPQPGPRYKTLGKAGDHTLAQAAGPSLQALRAARLTGDRGLAAEALEAMKQMERYEVPRGAQTWECPLYQPDILASALAIRAYCEAYRLTEDPTHLAHARYWAWSGLPFLYLWEMDGYPTMRHNVISVFGSTFYTHSWLGLPVVWCGLVYAYALQDLAEFDDSFDWNQIAAGITHSAMWQQYAEGGSVGTYPDSWDMVQNKANPADINPENILVNGFRLRGRSPEIQFRRIEGPEGVVCLNSAARIVRLTGNVDAGGLEFRLRGDAGFPVYTLLAPVDPPKHVTGVGHPAGGEAQLQSRPLGWYYDELLRGIVFKTNLPDGDTAVRVSW